MIRNFLDISTAHLSPAAKAWLDECGRLNANANIDPDGDCGGGSLGSVGLTLWGYFLICPDQTQNGNWTGMPAELLAVCAFAQTSGCDGVLFDADADILDALPTWDW